MGGNVRKAVNEGRADAIPIFLHEIPLLFRRGLIPVDVALINVRKDLEISSKNLRLFSILDFTS
jgi:acyl-CoA hydrolase